MSPKIIVILKGSKIRATTVLIFFIGSFVFTSESLSLFKGFDPNFHFHVNSSITNNAFEVLLWTKIWNLEKIPLNNERLSIVNWKFLTKYQRTVALILLPYNISIILKPEGHINGRLILLIARILNF